MSTPLDNMDWIGIQEQLEGSSWMNDTYMDFNKLNKLINADRPGIVDIIANDLNRHNNDPNNPFHQEFVTILEAEIGYFLPTTGSNSSISLPLCSLREVEEVEQYLANSDNDLLMRLLLLGAGGRTIEEIEDATRFIMSRLLTDPVCSHFHRSVPGDGVGLTFRQYPFILATVVDAVKRMLNIPNGASSIEVFIEDWLVGSGARLQNTEDSFAFDNRD